MASGLHLLVHKHTLNSSARDNILAFSIVFNNRKPSQRGIAKSFNLDPGKVNVRLAIGSNNIVGFSSL